MSFAKVSSAGTSFLNAYIVDVEVDLSRGLHSFSIVGLGNKAVDEAKDRVSAAIKNTEYTPPKQHNKKIVVALAPAEQKKEGPVFDLAIALGYVLATEEVSFDPAGKLFLGELSLDGELRPVRGVLQLVQKAQQEGFTEVFVPKDNADEAVLVEGITVFAMSSLKEVIDHLEGKRPCAAHTAGAYEHAGGSYDTDFADVRGQEEAKRALEIAAAGGHNIALYGPAGTGKSMLAKAFTGILPELTREEALEVTAIHSVAGTLDEPLVCLPPFRCPHHTSSYVSLIGGGAVPKPGEVTLAHKGVLFLDEFPEFDRRVIDSLRQPLEDRVVSISRAHGSARFPADFILVAALNPPSETTGAGVFVSEQEMNRYRRKMSKPIVDRIDLWSQVNKIPHEELAGKPTGESSESIRHRVSNARKRQRKRGMLNSSMGVKDIEKHVTLAPDVKEILHQSAQKFDLSPRAYHKMIKLSRTIADLAGEEEVAVPHMLEALQYRPKKELFE